MKNNNKKRNKIILLVVILLGLSIGFAALSTTLKINGLAGIKKNSWRVYWSNAQIVTGSVTTNLPTITQDSGDPVNTKAVWSTTFTEPGQYYSFTIDATNAGTLDALIETIETTTTPATLPEYITYSITYANGSPLQPNDLLPKANGNTPTTKKYRVMVVYDPTNEQYDAIPAAGVTVSFESKPIYKQKPVVHPTPGPETPTVKVTLKSGDVNLKGKTDQELVEYYGTDITGHTATQTAWQLFYSDEDNIYLIAKDYIRNKFLPSQLAKIEDTDENPTYHADFGNCTLILERQYIMSDIVHNDPWKAGTDATVLKKNPLTNKYLKWVNLHPGEVSENAQALAYMMDTSVWKDFAGNVKGAYAMGGPMLEMWVLSYNSKHETQFETYSTVDSTNTTTKGYKVKKTTDSNWSDYGTSIPTQPVVDDMWIIYSKDKANEYWLASPSGNVYDSSPYMYYIRGYDGGDGSLNSMYIGQHVDSEQCGNYNDYTGFRPVVAIPKSSLE